MARMFLLLALPAVAMISARAATLPAATPCAQVDLTWDAPAPGADPPVGYNAYRSPNGASSYAQINSDVIEVTEFVDTTVAAEASYDYIVESVDNVGVESGPSNVASVTVPTMYMAAGTLVGGST